MIFIQKQGFNIKVCIKISYIYYVTHILPDVLIKLRVKEEIRLERRVKLRYDH